MTQNWKYRNGDEPPPEYVFPGPEEAARAFAAYGCEIVGPPPSL